LSLYQRKELTTFEASRKAAEEAYKRAKLTPADIDVLELHDTFSNLRLIALEDLGFAAKGNGGELLVEGECCRDGKLPTNTFGGLKARGHPVGASGM
jgi:acetyl-CoA C-acetyltransferase